MTETTRDALYGAALTLIVASLWWAVWVGPRDAFLTQTLACVDARGGIVAGKVSRPIWDDCANGR